MAVLQSIARVGNRFQCGASAIWASSDG